MPPQQQDRARKRATYLTLIGVFTGAFVAFTGREKREGNRLDIGPYDLALLGLATFRTARITAFDQVTEPLRAPVTETNEEGGVEPKGTGAQQAIGELISCPTCVGTWIAALLVYALRLAPIPTRVFLAILAAGGIAEALDYAVGAFDASAKASRAQAEQAGA